MTPNHAKNIDAILAVPGVDALYVGPNDQRSLMNGAKAPRDAVRTEP